MAHELDDDSTHTAGDAPGPLPAGEPRYVGRYMVVDTLGIGGMGVVYRAFDPDLARLIALKLVRREQARPIDTARLRREARAAARLSHPNVVGVYDVGVVDGELYIAMELVEGCSLHDWLRARPRALTEILDVFVQAAHGLAAAHERGLVHRDFKPPNVLIGDDGRVRVADFGLARLVSGESAPPDDMPLAVSDARLTITGRLVGTPRYMAPEQLGENPVDHRADQFAFCVALYEAVTGRRPFAGGDARALFANLRKGNLRPFPDSDRTPEWLRALIVRGLSLAPDDRYPSMHELTDELTRDRQADRRAALDGSTSAEPMLAAFPPPEDGAASARVHELRLELEEAWQLKRDGALDDALSLARRVTGAAHRLDYLPLRAAALYTLGNLQHRTGDSRAARETLYLAAEVAAAAGDDWQVANCWIFLISVLAIGLRAHDEAEAIARVASVALARVGENPSLRSRLYANTGAAEVAAGRHQAAVRNFELALALDERTHGAAHPFLAMSLLGLAEALIELGEPELARRHLERARAIAAAAAPRMAASAARCAALLDRLPR